MFDQIASYSCAYCGSENTVEVDISGGMEQEYYEDCEACSRSNRILIHFDDKNLKVSINAKPEY